MKDRNIIGASIIVESSLDRKHLKLMLRSIHLNSYLKFEPAGSIKSCIKPPSNYLNKGDGGMNENIITFSCIPALDDEYSRILTKFKDKVKNGPDNDIICGLDIQINYENIRTILIAWYGENIVFEDLSDDELDDLIYETTRVTIDNLTADDL